MGGATPLFRALLNPSSGLSPRGRGNRVLESVAGGVWGSIPAWAGQPPDRHHPQRTIRVYPRVGGATRTRCAPE